MPRIPLLVIGLLGWTLLPLAAQSPPVTGQPRAPGSIPGRAVAPGPTETRRSSARPRAQARPRNAAGPVPESKPVPSLFRGSSGAPAATGTSDAALARGEFATALHGYVTELGQSSLPGARRSAVEMQISRCFAGLQRWDGAITWSEKGLAHAPGPLQRVTARLWRMELFLRLPRLGWRAGESRQLDLDPPTTEPGRTFLAEARTTEHLTQAVSEGTAALADFDSLPAAARQPADEAGLCVDLARTAERIWLEQGALVPPPGSTLGDWGAAPGDAVPAGDWHPLRLSAHYLRQAELRAPAGRKASLCLARAWWLRRHRATLQQSLTPGGPLPSHWDAASLALEAVGRYPGDPLLPQARLLAVRWLDEQGRDEEALAALEPLLVPGRPPAEQAEAARWKARLGQAELRIVPPGPLVPGRRNRLEMVVRKVTRIHLEARRLALAEALQDPALLPARSFRPGEPGGGTRDWLPILGGAVGLDPHLLGETIRWSVSPAETSAPPDRVGPPAPRPTSRSVWTQLPFTRPGAYLVRASGSGRTTAGLVLISDLALVGFPSPGASHPVWAVHSGTGAPASGVSLLSRRLVQAEDGKRRIECSTTRLAGNGLGAVPLGTAPAAWILAWKADEYALLQWAPAPPGPPPTASPIWVSHARCLPGERVLVRMYFPEGVQRDGDRAARVHLVVGGGTAASVEFAAPAQAGALATASLPVPLTVPPGDAAIAIRLPGRAEVRRPLRIQSPASRALRLMVQAAAPDTGGGAVRIPVRVADRLGSPQERAAVVVYSGRPGKPAAPAALTWTNAEGEAVLALPGSAGVVRVVARDRSGRQGSMTVPVRSEGPGATRDVSSTGEGAPPPSGPVLSYRVEGKGEPTLIVTGETPGMPAPVGGWLRVRNGRLELGSRPEPDRPRLQLTHTSPDSAPLAANELAVQVQSAEGEAGPVELWAVLGDAGGGFFSPGTSEPPPILFTGLGSEASARASGPGAAAGEGSYPAGRIPAVLWQRWEPGWAASEEELAPDSEIVVVGASVRTGDGGSAIVPVPTAQDGGAATLHLFGSDGAGRTSRETVPLAVELPALELLGVGRLSERDEALVAAVFRNRGEAPVRVSLELEAEGAAVAVPSGDPDRPTPRLLRVPRPDRSAAPSRTGAPAGSGWTPLGRQQVLLVPSGGERTATWRVVGSAAGTGRLRVQAEVAGEHLGAEMLLTVDPLPAPAPSTASRVSPESRGVRLQRNLIHETTAPAGEGSPAVPVRRPVTADGWVLAGERVMVSLTLDGVSEKEGVELEQQLPPGALLVGVTGDANVTLQEGIVRANVRGPRRTAVQLHCIMTAPGLFRLTPALVRAGRGGTELTRSGEQRLRVEPTVPTSAESDRP